MKKYISLLLSLCILFPFFCITDAKAAIAEKDTVRVGLFYGSSALATANLENNTGSGYRLGYYEGAGNFVNLGSTGETQISMLKTQNIYLKDSLYYDSDPGGSSTVIGCYHIELSNTYSSFQEAQAAANSYTGGFPAWVSGRYVVRVGAYASKDAAQTAQSSFGLPSSSIVGTSSNGITVTRTKTANILFQFDGSATQVFAVKPGLDDSTKTQTWFKGYRYYGDFLYERIGGTNITVSNYLSMEDYIKGILPYEMSSSWPIEALKAQAVCARNYTIASTGNRHTSQHFDICNSTCCQVYRGTNSANANTDRAVEETRGIYARYNGNIAQTFYYSSNGGASEDVKNVWGTSSNLPYLAGVKDPYEASIESSISNYRWTVNFTSEKLTSMLKAKGYQCGTIVDLKVTEYTPLGNVLSIAFVDSSGATFPFSRERARTILGLNSMRFSINGGSSVGTGSYYVDEGGKTLSGLSGLYTVGEGGSTAQLPANGNYAITASGNEALVGVGAGGGSTSGQFTVTGSGNGHHVGLSQWGAYAMAKQGKTYTDILKFYFTGIDLY